MNTSYLGAQMVYRIFILKENVPFCIVLYFSRYGCTFTQLFIYLFIYFYLYSKITTNKDTTTIKLQSQSFWPVMDPQETSQGWPCVCIFRRGHSNMYSQWIHSFQRNNFYLGCQPTIILLFFQAWDCYKQNITLITETCSITYYIFFFNGVKQ